MKKLGIFMADGCEEIEGLTAVDILRRANIEVVMIGITDRNQVTGAHGIVFEADAYKDEVDYEALDGIILPGGMPGTNNLFADETVKRVTMRFAQEGKLIAAICAAPGVVLGGYGLLEGKRATCYPGFEEKMIGAKYVNEPVVCDDNIITSRGMGTALDFALEILAYADNRDAAQKMADNVQYQR